jgi:hypothetical protein
MKQAMHRLALMLRVTPERLDATLTAQEKAAWLAYLSGTTH